MHSEEYKANQRTKRLARQLKRFTDGFCTECGKVPPVKDLLKCAKCGERAKLNSRKHYNKVRGTAEYISYRKQYRRKKYLEAISLKVCTQCRKKPPQFPYQQCAVCRLKSIRYSQKRRKRIALNENQKELKQESVPSAAETHSHHQVKDVVKTV